MTLAIQPMICGNCDCENDAGARYCSACGWSPELGLPPVDQFVTSLSNEAAVTALRLLGGKQALQTSTQVTLDRNAGLTHISPSQEPVRPATTDPIRAGLDAASQRRAGAALPPAPKPRFTIPTSQPTRRWIEATRALEASFIAAAAEAEKKAADIAERAEAQIATHKAEVARLRNVASVFTQLLQQVGFDAPASTPPRRRSRTKAEGAPWARLRSGETIVACTKCGRTDRKHKAEGRCETCYL